jgi:hypothetical protein
LLEHLRKALRAAEERARGLWKNARDILRPVLQRSRTYGKMRDSIRAKNQLRAAERRARRRELKKGKLRDAKERAQRRRQEKLERRSRREPERADSWQPDMGALPDFAIIGQRRCGTTFLYHLLSLHPHVERALKKEPYFFSASFDEGVEWYRQYFPAPRMKEGRMTITGEASPLMANTRVPERMASVIPDARLIALLRDPVDRTYSDYQQVVRKGRETRPFEEAVGLDENGPDDEAPYVMRSLYADQLQRWWEYFGKDQLLVLKSEELYESPAETLKVVLDFLGLPGWEPEASEVMPKKQNKGGYEGGMDPETRKRLEEYFRPHNRRLYDYLGLDFGW